MNTKGISGLIECIFKEIQKSPINLSYYEMVLIDRGRSISRCDSSPHFCSLQQNNMHIELETIDLATNFLKNNISLLRKFTNPNETIHEYKQF